MPLGEGEVGKSVFPGRLLESLPARPRHPGDPFQGLDRVLFAEGANEGAEPVSFHRARAGVKARDGMEDRNGAIDPLFDLVEPGFRRLMEPVPVLVVLQTRDDEIGADRKGAPHADRDGGRDKGAKATLTGGFHATIRRARDIGWMVVSRHVRRICQSAG